MKFFKKKVKAQPTEKYYSSSEFVSSGHPDRVADNIAAIVINDIQHKDGVNSHAAIEVFLTHDTVYFGGEATTTMELSKEYLQEAVRLGFERSGYLPEARQYWTKKEVMLAEDMKIVNKICAQSPDIAMGTTDKGAESGWNDQGVYFSSCDDTNVLGLGTPHFIAQQICETLQEASKVSILGGGDVILGPDNKCVVTCLTEADGFTPIAVTAVTIAIAHSASSDIEKVRTTAMQLAIATIRNLGYPIVNNCQWVINGTGRFVVHGCISDTSMTGRKNAVNHPSAGPVWSNKMIGGGSLVKPMHASDLMLNLASRYISEVVVCAGLSSYAIVGCAGAIGRQGLQSIFIKGDDNFEAKINKDKVYSFFKYFIEWSPIAIAKKFGFFSEDFDFGMVVNYNFFGHPEFQPWEDFDVIKGDAKALQSWLRV